MSRLEINNVDTFIDGKLTIMIFTEGTVLGPKRLIDHFNHTKYVPIKNCIAKINSWSSNGAQIIYLTSRRKESSIQSVKRILVKYGFPGQYLYYRSRGEKYKDIVENIMPDILIEDDCKSIGGRWQMSITNIDRAIRNKIISIIVKEFKGIDLLPDNLTELMNYKNN